MKQNLYFDILRDNVRMDFDPEDYLPNDIAADEFVANTDSSADTVNFLVDKLINISVYQSKIANSAEGQNLSKFGLMLAIIAAVAGYLLSDIVLQLTGEFCFGFAVLFALASFVGYYFVVRHSNHLIAHQALVRGSFAEHALNELVIAKKCHPSSLST